MLNIKINSETSLLKAVILGIANSNGPIPHINDCYDPKSKEHILNGTYPTENSMVKEMSFFEKVLKKHGVEVYRPKLLKDYNQIFSRDISFVIDDKLIISNMIENRSQEISAVKHILNDIPESSIIKLPKNCHIEGGDVIVDGKYIFIGTYSGTDYSSYITARTNKNSVEIIKSLFPKKIVRSFELRKSNSSPKDNALHLDCCFQPVGNKYAIIHKGGFLLKDQCDWLVNFYGEENIFFVDKDEMYNMNCNIFSISEDTVVSEKSFERLNNWLEKRNINVEKINYSEISKQEGLLRCSTMPLIRK
jgi:N-dimethylarginine dimethylaminohydrolase